MELYTLNISVSNQKLEFGDNLPEIYSGDQSIDYVQFTFDDSKWDGFTDIWAVFNRYRGRSYQVELENGKAKIPAEVMINGGHIFIGLLGTDGENVQTSSVLEYSIGQGATNSDLIAPSENIYEQFLSDLDAYQTAKSELESIESRLTTAETTLTNLEPRVTAVDTTVSDMEDTVDGLVSDVSGVRTTVDGLLTDVTNLQTSVTALESAVPTLQRDVSALQTGVTNLESRMTALSTSVGSLEDRLATVQTSLTDLEDGLTDAEGRLTTIGNQITDAQTDIEEIETAIEQDNIVTDVTGGGVSFVNNRVADLSFVTVTDTATGGIATFPDGSGLNAVATEIEIEPKQAGSGTPSPDNVREISGWTEVNLNSTGINVWDEEWEVGTINVLNGQNEGNNNRIRSKNYIPVIGGTTYSFSIQDETSISTFRCVYYDANKNYLSGSAYFPNEGSATRLPFTFTPPTNARYMRFSTPTTDYGPTYRNDISINYPSTDTTYHAYNGISTTINLGQTVYGATIYPEEGRGVITMAMVDMGTLNWTLTDGTDGYFYATVSTLKNNADWKSVSNMVCEAYQTTYPNAIVNKTIDKAVSAWKSGNRLIARDTSYTDATAFKTAMNGVQLCYELATPIEFTFPPVSIPTLNGTNNIWADSGDIEVEYIADIKKYIEKVVG